MAGSLSVTMMAKMGPRHRTLWLGFPLSAHAGAFERTLPELAGILADC